MLEQVDAERRLNWWKACAGARSWQNHGQRSSTEADRTFLVGLLLYFLSLVHIEKALVSYWHPRRVNTLHQYFTQSYFTGKVENKACPEKKKKKKNGPNYNYWGFFLSITIDRKSIRNVFCSAR